MYTAINYLTKKALKDALKNGASIEVYQPNDMFGKTDAIQQGTHTVYLEGPHYPQPHKWYAQAVVKDGRVVKVS